MGMSKALGKEDGWAPFHSVTVHILLSLAQHTSTMAVLVTLLLCFPEHKVYHSQAPDEHYLPLPGSQTCPLDSGVFMVLWGHWVLVRGQGKDSCRFLHRRSHQQP